jgi:hypothetical protein
MVSRLEGILLLGEKAWPKSIPTKDKRARSKIPLQELIARPKYIIRRPTISPDEGQSHKMVRFRFAVQFTGRRAE